MFRAYLKPVSECESCGLDMAFADSGDGPAIFIIFIVGFLIVGMAAMLDAVLHPPVFVHLMIWLPMTVILCLALLPPFKAIMIALQYTNDAKEGRPDRY